jgi:3D (Asp-Asp-Asp) domain-containing protein
MSIAFLSIIFPATGNLKADEKLFIPPQAKPIKVRLTTYHRNEDYWTSRLKSSSGHTLKEGVSVAVDPRIFPYGSKIYIEGVGIRKVHDTGTAVISKKASGGKLPIVDVFFMQKRCAEAFANSHRYARVWVIEKK